jgi:hypothetical protein
MKVGMWKRNNIKCVVDTIRNLVREVNMKTRKPSITQKMINTTDERSGRMSTKKGKLEKNEKSTEKSHTQYQ